jgi:electron transfer flavoprotein alpha/beta subunit
VGDGPTRSRRRSKKHGFDLVICGRPSRRRQYGSRHRGALAEHLGVPGLTNAAKIDIADGKLRVERETDSGHQTVTAPLPAVLMVTMGVGEPRYASLKGIMGAKKKTIAILPAGELALDGPIGTRRREDRAAPIALRRARQGPGRRPKTVPPAQRSFSTS